MRAPIRLIAPMLAIAMSACGATQAGTPPRPATATPTISPTATPTPHVTVIGAGARGFARLLPRSPASLRNRVAVLRRHQLDRNQHGPHPGIELGGGAGPDAVHAGDLGQLWPRRCEQSARRDPGRRSLPAGAR